MMENSNLHLFLLPIFCALKAKIFDSKEKNFLKIIVKNFEKPLSCGIYLHILSDVHILLFLG